MAYAFSESEKLEIATALENSEINDAPWWELYQVVSSILKDALADGRVAISDIQQTEAARLWFDGAVQVSKGEGVFSSLIRGYTAHQFEYRLGSSNMTTVITEVQIH